MNKPLPPVAPMTPVQQLLVDNKAQNFAQAMMTRFGKERTAYMLSRRTGKSVTACRTAMRYWTPCR